MHPHASATSPPPSILMLPVTCRQIAIEGCCHGELDNIYATLEYMQNAKGQKVDLLICCGDFQVGVYTRQCQLCDMCWAHIIKARATLAAAAAATTTAMASSSCAVW